MTTTPLPPHIEAALSRIGVVAKRAGAHAPVAWPKPRPAWPVVVTVLDADGQPEF
jgi:hypothetical protein